MCVYEFFTLRGTLSLFNYTQGHNKLARHFLCVKDFHTTKEKTSQLWSNRLIYPRLSSLSKTMKNLFLSHLYSRQLILVFQGKITLPIPWTLIPTKSVSFLAQTMNKSNPDPNSDQVYKHRVSIHHRLRSHHGFSRPSEACSLLQVSHILCFFSIVLLLYAVVALVITILVSILLSGEFTFNRKGAVATTII